MIKKYGSDQYYTCEHGGCQRCKEKRCRQLECYIEDPYFFVLVKDVWKKCLATPINRCPPELTTEELVASLFERMDPILDKFDRNDFVNKYDKEEYVDLLKKTRYLCEVFVNYKRIREIIAE